VKEHAEHGNPASVVACMDEFASTTHIMNVGDVKGKIIDEEISKKQPTIMAELGGYTGYSAVRFANKQREAAGNKPSHYHSFEFSQVFAARMREMVELAGLGDQVTVHVGPFSEQYGVLLGKTVDVSSASSSCYGAETQLSLTLDGRCCCCCCCCCCCRCTSSITTRRPTCQT